MRKFLNIRNIFRSIRAHRKTAVLVFGAFLIPLVVPVFYLGLTCRGAYPAAVSAIPPDPAQKDVALLLSQMPDYQRDKASTYLTFPEWYIVYSAEEYANFLAHHRPSQFPYVRSIAQYWRSYCHGYGITKQQRVFNRQDHVVLYVIGQSFSIEYALKGIYENTIGRLSELAGFFQPVEEDAYAQKVAFAYGRFLHHTPWYDFPFAQKLLGLTLEPRVWGISLVRKFERRIILSFEYTVKALYGGLIRKATKTALTPAEAEIMLWVDNVSPALLEREPRIRVVRQLDAVSQVITVPRYDPFTEIVLLLTRERVRFHQIAGNDEILMTALMPRRSAPRVDVAAVLFTMPILTDPDTQRVAVRTPVRSLPEVVFALDAQGARIEHLYDY